MLSTAGTSKLAEAQTSGRSQLRVPKIFAT
jgi:hypothetical protein